MSLTSQCGAAVGVAHCASFSEASRLSNRLRCAVSDPRTSAKGTSPISMQLPNTVISPLFMVTIIPQWPQGQPMRLRSLRTR
jgi:hypothetical protein